MKIKITLSGRNCFFKKDEVVNVTTSGVITNSRGKQWHKGLHTSQSEALQAVGKMYNYKHTR